MGTLSYTATVSLDGYVADADGDFQWSAPDAEVFRFHVDRMGAVAHEVLGRNTYALMEYWQNPPEGEEWGPDEQEFARRWQAIPRTLVSSTMTAADLASDTDRLVPRLDTGTLRRIVDEADEEVEIFGGGGDPRGDGERLPALRRPPRGRRGPARAAAGHAPGSGARRAARLRRRDGVPALPEPVNP